MASDKKKYDIYKILSKASNIIEKIDKNLDLTSSMNQKEKEIEITNKNNTVNSIDKIDLLEYSINNKNVEISEENDFIEEEESKVNSSESLDLKKYKNFHIKFNKVKFIENLNATISNLFYLECKIPIMKSKGGEDLLYDEFKIFFQNEENKNEIELNKISIHNVNLEDSNFSALTNSKIMVTLHMKSSQPLQQDKKGQVKNADVIIGAGYLELNKVFLSKKFNFYGEITLVKKVLPKKTNSKKIKEIPETFADVAKIEISCVLSKENENVAILNEAPKEINVNINNQIPQSTNEIIVQSGTSPDIQSESIEEIKTDLFDDILIIYLDISKLTSTNPLSEKNQNKNYFIMHKVFPTSAITTSDIKWNETQPDFKYTFQMPFTLNQNTAEMLANNCFVVEIWNKGHDEDELVGTINFEMCNILEMLKVDNDTITVRQLYRNIDPYKVYKDSYPVKMFDDEIEGALFLKVSIMIGTPLQVSNYIRENTAEKTTEKTKDIFNYREINIGQNNNPNIEKDISLVKVKDTGVNVAEESLDPFRDDKIIEKKPTKGVIKDIDNEEKKMTNIIGNVEEDNSRANDINVDEIFEKNKKEIENLNTKYKLTPNSTNQLGGNINADFKKSSSSNFEMYNKEDVVNPFLVPQTEERFNNTGKETGTAGFKVSKENVFSIGENFYSHQNKSPKDKETPKEPPLWHSENNVNFMDSKFNNFNVNPMTNINNNNINTSLMKDKEQSNIEEDKDKKYFSKSQDVNTNVYNLNMIPEKEESSKTNIKISENLQQQSNKTSMQKDKIIRYTFTITIDKIINCKVLSLVKNPFIRYQFFKDENGLRSENLTYTSYKDDTSVIDVDMKSSHSLLLTPTDSISKYLGDFAIEIAYRDGDDIFVIGTVNIPADALMISSSESSTKTFSEFIRGTDKINRNGCIIGKISFNIATEVTEENVSLKNFSNGEIFIEKETIFNRKIPKNANLNINIGNFSSLNLFEEYYRKQFNFYFIISPFGEITSMEKKYGKRTTSKKHNVLSAYFGEGISFKLELDQDIINYFKCRNCIIYLVYKTSLLTSNEEEDEFNDISVGKNIIGKGYMSLSDILTSADQIKKNVIIKQLGNESGSLGELSLDISLQNGSEDTASPSLTTLSRKGFGMNFNPNLYLNGRFLFIVNFDKLLFNNNSMISTQLGNEFYFVFKLGKNLKKVTPKFSLNDTNLYQLTNTINMFLLNHSEFFDLNLNFAKKSPFDLYNQFNESVLEIKIYQNEAESLGSFYIDIHKLISSDFYSENILHSGNNLINLIETKNNKSKNAKLQIDLSLIKISDDLPDDYFKIIFSPEFASHLISIKPNKHENNLEMIQKSINLYTSIDLSSFISDNLIDLASIEHYKLLFKLITKLNYDIFSYYVEHTDILSKGESDFAVTNVFTKGEDDINILNYYKDQTSSINIGVNVNNPVNKIDNLSYALFLSNYLNAINSTIPVEENANEENVSDNEPEVNMKKMIIDVYNGMNLVLPNSDLNSRPNCFFVLEFDDKTYKSDIIAKTSQPAWNEELEIKICESDYTNKLNSLPIIISVFSAEIGGDVFIGKGEIFPYKLFPFLNEDNEVEDFYHVCGENGNVTGQLNVKVKFESNVGGNVRQAKTCFNFEGVGLGPKDSMYWDKTIGSKTVSLLKDDDETLKRKLEEALNTVDNLTMELHKNCSI